MHIKRLSSPNNWKISKKANKWVVRPMPGAHPLDRCVPLTIILRDILNYADTTKEVKAIINSNDILIDGKPVKNHRAPIGVMDILELKKLNEHYFIIINENNYFSLKKITKEQSNTKPLKIINKVCVKKGKTQLNFYNGTNLLLKDKKEDKYKVGDTLLLDLKTKKIIKHLKMEKGAFVYLIAGKHVGKKGIVEEIINKGIHNDLLTINMGKEKIQTLKDYAFVIEEKMI